MASIDFDKLVIARLDDTTIGVNSFENKNPDMVRHIKEYALHHQEKKMSTTWVWVYDNKIAVGYISLAMFSIDRKDWPKRKDQNTHTVQYHLY